MSYLVLSESNDEILSVTKIYLNEFLLKTPKQFTHAHTHPHTEGAPF